MPRPKGSLGNAIIALNAFLQMTDEMSLPDISESLLELKDNKGIYPISHFANPKVLRRYVPKVWVRLLLGYTSNRLGDWRLASGGAFDAAIDWYLKCGVDVLDGVDCWTVRELFVQACASTSMAMAMYLAGRLKGWCVEVELTACKSLEICQWLISLRGSTGSPGSTGSTDSPGSTGSTDSTGIVIRVRVGHRGQICPHIFDYLYAQGMLGVEDLVGVVHYCVHRETVARAYLILSDSEWDRMGYLDYLIEKRLYGLMEKLGLLDECLERLIEWGPIFYEDWAELMTELLLMGG